MENPPRSPSVCFHLRLEGAFVSWEKQAHPGYLNTSNHCTMTFVLNSHQRPLKRTLAAAAERRNNINMNKPHCVCQAEQPHLLSWVDIWSPKMSRVVTGYQNLLTSCQLQEAKAELDDLVALFQPKLLQCHNQHPCLSLFVNNPWFYFSSSWFKFSMCSWHFEELRAAAMLYTGLSWLCLQKEWINLNGNGESLVKGKHSCDTHLGNSL